LTIVLTKWLDQKVEMSYEVVGNIAGEHDSLGRGVILQLLDDVGQSVRASWFQTVDLRVGIIESNPRRPD
jgi:hypothetical protein